MKRTVVTGHWPLLGVVQQDTGAQPEAQSQVRKLEEELGLEKAVQVSTTLLASSRRVEISWKSWCNFFLGGWAG